MNVTKFIFAFVTVVATTGCTNLARLAPPGFLKYEDLEKNIPPNPEIQARIEEEKDASDASFPVLSDQPISFPSGTTSEERAAQKKLLLKEHHQLNENAAADRASANDDRQAEVDALYSLRDELASDIAAQRKQAEAEKKYRPR